MWSSFPFLYKLEKSFEIRKNIDLLLNCFSSEVNLAHFETFVNFVIRIFRNLQKHYKTLSCVPNEWYFARIELKAFSISFTSLPTPR